MIFNCIDSYPSDTSILLILAINHKLLDCHLIPDLGIPFVHSHVLRSPGCHPGPTRLVPVLFLQFQPALEEELSLSAFQLPRCHTFQQRPCPRRLAPP